MCDVASPVANGADTPTSGNENGNDSAATTIKSFCNDSFATYITISLLCKRHYDVAIVCVVIAAVWALLALPTIFYHLPMKTSNQPIARNSSTVCTPEIYTGSICREALQTQQSCLLDRNTSSDILIAVDSASSQSTKEEQASLFIQGLPLLAPGPECMKAVAPFLCFYIFPLCDSSSGLHQPSSEECSEITEDICAREFQTAAMFATDDQLPQCQLLPDTALKCNETDDAGEDTVNDTSTVRVCSEGFYISENTGLCVPECGVWEEFPKGFIIGFDAVVILSTSVNILSSTVALIISCISYKRMFSFPSILIVYGVIAFGILSVFLLIGVTDHTSLYCTSRDLLMSVENKTPFCTLSGLLFYCNGLEVVILWLCHVAILFWKVKFPFHAKRFESNGYIRYIHAMTIFAVCVMPLGTLGAVLGSGGFTISRFPPVACYARSNAATFYSFILPISIAMAVGVSLIAIILWVIVVRVGAWQKPSKRGSDKQMLKNISTPEMKVLIIFIYFIIFGVVGLTSFTLAIQNIPDFISELTTYFVCESQGVQPGKTCERRFVHDRLGVDISLMFVYMLIGFYPVVNLVYIINFQELKEKFKFKLPSRSSRCHNPEPALTSKASV